MLKPIREKGHWRINNGKVVSSLTAKGAFRGEVKYWPALLDAATQGERCYIRNRGGWEEVWEEVDGELVTYRQYPFIKLFTYLRPQGWVIITERFTGKQIRCSGWKSVPNKRRHAIAVIKERGMRSFVEGIRKGIRKSGKSPTYENININQYLRGWESTFTL